ncbi:ParB/RepB/Spo0J family partition protein [uncultured Roseobacter sp.]|uniref:ParB/RepB/Spo0J family partition protein n=1 Tax=uncultured Roseobacter sp. TaxID=114847 RepID=UPI002603D526|nr:ParB/RepB/Spo0J family partition protein [uncultured Roseobacter sp.]
MELQHIKLSDLTPASLNVRKRGGKNIADLLPSLRAHGLLQPLLVRSKDEGFEIVAGQRRYHALCALAEEQDNAEDVPCLVMAQGDDAKAIEASLAENVARLPMDEIDQYRAFAALVRQGQMPAEIASQFGVTERLVTQRLAIANILSPILTAYREDKIHPETLRILTMATKKQQRAWLKLLKSKDDHAPEGHRLKAWLFGGAGIATTNALFDLADYKGAIVSDLFGEDSYFGDSEAFWAMQNTAIAAAKEACLADGWSDVIVLEVGEYFPSWDYVDAAKEDGGKVYVEIAQCGEVTFHEGHLSRKEINARDSKSGDVPKIAKPEVTQAMQTYLGLHKHAAVRQSLTAHQGIALRLATAQIIAGSALWQCHADPQKAAREGIAESLSQNPAQVSFAEQRAEIAALLGLSLAADQTLVPRKHDYGARRDLEGLMKTLRDLSDEDVMRILTFVVAETLPAQSVMVETLGAEMETDMTSVWSPDPTFFDLMRDKTALNAMVAEVAGEEVAAAHITSTARVQKSVIQACLDGTRQAKVKDWSPRYMQFPMQSYKRNDVEETKTRMAAE